MQPKFSFGAVLAAIALFASVVAADILLEAWPNRRPAPPTVAALELVPIDLSAAELAPMALVGAWRLTSSEPRFGGVSGLAVEGEDLVAITDAGAVLRFPKLPRRGMRVQADDLPSGPGDGRFRKNRDSEAIFRDPKERGWWVAFETRDELWLYDSTFQAALARVGVPRTALATNSGIEALTGGEGGLLAFPEIGGSALRWKGGVWSEASLDQRSPVTEAVQIDGESVLLLERRVTATGFHNTLALLRADESAFRTLWRKRLPVGRLDNVEALAAEPIAGGGYRLWMMSDDNFHPRLRTVLLILDVPAAALPKRR